MADGLAVALIVLILSVGVTGCDSCRQETVDALASRPFLHDPVSATAVSRHHRIEGLEDIVRVYGNAADYERWCALDIHGRAFCWYYPDSHRLPIPYSEPERGSVLKGIEEMSFGFRNMCARLESGALYCWGSMEICEPDHDWDCDGHPYEIDLQSFVGDEPVLLAGSALGIRDVSSWDNTACAVTEKDIRCWGYRPYWRWHSKDPGRDLLEPTIVSRSRGISEIFLDDTTGIDGGNRTCALTQEGVFSCWADSLPEDEPPTLWKLEDVEQVAVGTGTWCARKADGTVMWWKTTACDKFRHVKDAPGPERVLDLPPVSHVSTSLDQSCAVLEDGRVMCWRYVARDGKAGCEVEGPDEVTGLTDVAGVAVTNYGICAWHENGSVSCLDGEG